MDNATLFWMMLGIGCVQIVTGGALASRVVRRNAAGHSIRVADEFAVGLFLAFGCVTLMLAPIVTR